MNNTVFKIGNVIKHNSDPTKVKGVIIFNFPNSHLLLKPNAHDSCSFAKIQNDNLYSEYSPDTNNINHEEHSEIKRTILKFIQTRNLSDKEQKVLQPIINYAFPNGLPKYNPEVIDTERILVSKNLKDKLLPKKQFILYTKQHSPFKHCNEHKCVVLKNTPEGMWTTPIEKYMPMFMPYINNDGPTFYGVSRISPYTPETNNLSSLENTISKYISNMESEILSGNMRSHINLGDERVQVLPYDNYKIIIPSKYHNQRYDFKLDRCINCSNDSDSEMSNTYTGLINLSENKPTLQSITSDMYDTPYLPKLKSSGDNEFLVSDYTSNGLQDMNNLTETYEDVKFSKDDYHSDDLLSLLAGERIVSDSELDEEDDGFENSQYYNDLHRYNNIDRMIGGSGKTKSKTILYSPGTDSDMDTGSDSETVMSHTDNSYSEMSESEPEFEYFDDEDFNMDEGEIIAKVRQIPKPEGLKVFKETIQKGRIKKQMYEKLPKFKRNIRSEAKIDKLVDKISLLKIITTNKENEIIYSCIDKHNESIKPLVEQFIKDDFTTVSTHKFLVPLVTASRKIYIKSDDKLTAKDFEENGQIAIDFYKDLELIDKEQQQSTFTKNRIVSNEEELRKNIERINPFSRISVGTGIGYQSSVGNKYINEYDKMFNDNGIYKLKTEIANDRIELYNKDATVYRLGTNQFKYLNFGVQERELEEIKLLAPFTTPIYEDKSLLTREEIEELDNMLDRNIEPTTRPVKGITSGDEYNIVGFVRPPINTIILNIIKDSIPDDIVDKTRINILNLSERVEEKVNNDKVIYKKINKIDEETSTVEFVNEKGGKKVSVEFSSAGFYLPNKYVIFSLPNINLETGNIKSDASTNLGKEEYNNLLHRIIPSVEDIITYIQSSPDLEFISSLTNSHEIISKILLSFGYFYNDQGLDVGFSVNETTNKLRTLSYSEYMYINKNENENLKKLLSLNDSLDKLYQLKLRKNNKSKENNKEGKSSNDDIANNIYRKAKIFTDDIMELTDKYYSSEPFSKKIIDSPQTKTDEFRISYLSLQKDLGKLYSNLLKKNYLLNLLDDFNLEKSKAVLDMLKLKYEEISKGSKEQLDSLSPELKEKMKVCGNRINRKPKIVRYPSADRLLEDNGKVSSTPSGDMIMEGDYALVEVDKEQENGAVIKEKQLYRRSTLYNGDYWVIEPLEALEKLLKNKSGECDGSDSSDVDLEKKRAMMKIDNIDDLKLEVEKATLSKEELQACTFDVDSIQCIPKEAREITEKLKLVKAEIQDTENAIKCATVLPIMISDVNKTLSHLESELHSYAMGNKAYSKFKKNELEKIIQENAELDKLMMGSKCSHTMAFKYIESLDNISDEEYYKYMKEHIIDKYVDDVQMSKIILDEVSKEPEDNFLKCNNCEGRLICKHYLYAIELMNADDDHRLDMGRLVSVYGYTDEETNYCKICGKFLNTTDTKDLEGFEGGEDGRIVKTREVVEERDVIADMKKTVSQMITKAIHNTEGKLEQEDLRKKIEVYDLCKMTCGIKGVIVEDDLEMISFLKSYNHSGVTRKGLKSQIYLQFLKLGRKLTDSQLTILTEQEYLKILIVDVIVRFLVLLQTSKQQYQVSNKYFNGNYMGYPLLTTNKTQDKDGINLCFNIAKQLSVIPKYRYLSSGKSGIISILNTINARLDLLIENDELVRSKLQTSLERKYADITEKEEELKAHSYYWSEYRPHIGFSSLESSKPLYTWAPQTDFQPSEIKAWTSTNLDKMIDLIHSNISSRQQNTLRGMEGVVFNMEYTTKMVRDGQVCNGVALYELINTVNATNSTNTTNTTNSTNTINTTNSTNTITVNINKNKVNYYDLFMSRMPELSKLLKQTQDLGDALDKLKIIKSPPRIIIENYYIDPIKEGRNNIQFDFEVNQEEINKYFLKYIDNGQLKGQLHMFNDLGRCIISNILKKEKEQLTYTKHDLMTLYKFVSKSNIKQDITTVETHLVSLGLYNKDYVKETLMCGELYLTTEVLISNMLILSSLLEGNKYKKIVSSSRLNLLKETNTQLQTANAKLKDQLFINIIEECYHNQEFQHNVSMININLSKANKIVELIMNYLDNNINKLNSSGKIQTNIIQFLNLSLLLISRMIKYDYQVFNMIVKDRIKIGLISNITIENGKSMDKYNYDNKKKHLDSLGNMRDVFETSLDNSNQELIELIINKLRLEDVKQIDLISNTGNFNKLVNDTKKYMDIMSELIPDILYVNQELVLDKNLNSIKSNFLIKCVSVINYLVSNLSNNSWDNVKDLKEINKFYYEGFIKYQDVHSNFKDYKVFIVLVNNIIKELGIYNNDVYNSVQKDIFITEDIRYSYSRLCFLYVLGILLSGHNDTIFNLDTFEKNKKIIKEVSKKQNTFISTDLENKEFSKENSKKHSQLKTKKITSDNEFSYSDKLDKIQGGAISGDYDSNNDKDNDNDNLLENINDKMNKRLEDVDEALYPEMMVSENYQNEPGEDIENKEVVEDDILDLIEENLENKKNHNIIMKQFVSDIIIYLTDLQFITSSMNNETVEDEISKGRVVTVKETLRLNRDLSAEGMEDTRAMVNNLRMLGRLDYTNLAANYDNIMYGSGADEETNELEMNSTVPPREIIGDNDRELLAQGDIHGGDEGYYEEEVFVGVDEDMEGGDLDYGYIAVD